MAEEINKTYTSNSLYNDSTGVIAFAEQLKQELINWANYEHVTEKLGPDNRPDTQNQLNNLFLRVYEEFLTFLNNADATDEAINTWKEIENFLKDFTDDKTLASIVAELNSKIESRLTVPLESTTGSSTTSTMTQKAITETIDASKTFTTGEKVDNVGIDDEPTAGSNNLVKSGIIYNAVGGTCRIDMLITSSEHSSTKDRIKVFIPANTIFSVTPVDNSGNINNYTVYVRYKDSETFVNILGKAIDDKLCFVAINDIEEIGLYFTTTIRGLVHFEIKVISVNGRLVDIESTKLYNCFIGNNAAFSSKSIYGLIRGNTYRVYLKSTSWDITNTGSDRSASVFAISSKDANDVTTVLSSVELRGFSNIQPYYDVTIPADSEYIIIGGRATLSEKVFFSIVDITAITSLESEINTAKEDISNIKYAIDYNELSQLNLFAGSIYKNGSPAASDNCLCSTFYYRVTPSSVLRIQRESDIKIRIIQFGENKGYLRQNETYSNIDSVTLGSDTHFVRISADYSARGYSEENPITVEDFVEGDFGLYLGRANFVSLTENLTEEDKEKAQSNLGLSVEEILDPDSNNLLKNKIITEQLHNNYFVGKGNTYNKTKIVGLTSGNTYRVYFKETPWDMAGVTATGVYKLSVDSWYNNVATNIIAVSIASNLKPYYDFTIPENSDYITIGGRAANNALVRFTILDVTNILNIEGVDFPDDIRDFTFNVRQGVAHDASTDKRSTVIRKGSKMTVTVETTCVSLFNNFIVWYDDGTVANAAGSSYKVDSETHIYTFDFVTPKNIIQIGLGASAGAISSTGTVNVTLNIINALEKEINSIGEKLSFIESQSLTNEQKEIAKGNLGLIGNLSIKDLNPDIHNALVSAKSQESKYPTQPQNAMLAFLVATDIHHDWNHLQRAVKYVNDESSLIDGLLVLGDICDSPADLRSYDYASLMLQCTNPVLTIPGNHEVATANPLTNNEMMSEFYSAEMMEKNGDIHPEGKLYWYRDISHDYYYRDYDAGNYNAVGTHTLRVIGLCQADYCASEQKNDWYFSQEQIDWLVNVLDNTPVDTYVLILTHSTIEDNNNLTDVDNKFTSPYPAPSYTTLSNKSFITDIIRAWINGTTINESSANTIDDVVLSVNYDFSTPRNNKFVGFLSGHSHRDHVARINGTEAIYQINLHCTTSNLMQQNGDVGRETSGKLQDCLTIFVYDWFKHRIKLIRVGADITTEMKLRDFDIIDLV